MSYWKEVTSPSQLVKGQRIRFFDDPGCPDVYKPGMGDCDLLWRYWGSGGCGTDDSYPFCEWKHVEALFEDDEAPVVKKEAEEHEGYEAWSWSNQHPAYPLVDWKCEVANGDTERGYHDWVEACVERDRIV